MSNSAITSRWTRSLARVLPGLYDDLREIASRFMSGEREGHTLQPTALVHEAYIRLSESDSLHVRDATHARALAAKTMRRVLVDHARRYTRQKRSGKKDECQLNEDQTPCRDVFESLVGLDDALERLRRVNPRQARVLDLRCFGGLSIAEAAEELGVSPRTVTFDTRAACAWLRAEMSKGDAP